MDKINNKQNHWREEYQVPLYSGMIENILKFHNKTILINHENTMDPISQEVYDWALENEFKDTLPNLYLKKYSINSHVNNDYEGSNRIFNEESLTEAEFSKLIIKSFGTNQHNFSRRYPSAGGLYPILPILFLFEDNSIEDLTLPAGVYVIDTEKYELLLIKKIDSYIKIEFEKYSNFNRGIGLPSKYCIGYAINIRKSVTKYKYRGYRHALIEVGLMAQAFRETCRENSILGEFSSSAFDDFKTTSLAGLDVRNCPVVLLQWFGKK